MRRGRGAAGSTPPRGSWGRLRPLEAGEGRGVEVLGLLAAPRPLLGAEVGATVVPNDRPVRPAGSTPSGRKRHFGFRGLRGRALRRERGWGRPLGGGRAAGRRPQVPRPARLEPGLAGREWVPRSTEDSRVAERGGARGCPVRWEPSIPEMQGLGPEWMASYCVPPPQKIRFFF